MISSIEIVFFFIYIRFINDLAPKKQIITLEILSQTLRQVMHLGIAIKKNVSLSLIAVIQKILCVLPLIKDMNFNDNIIKCLIKLKIKTCVVPISL
jgi:hypothetical protein